MSISRPRRLWRSVLSACAVPGSGLGLGFRVQGFGFRCVRGYCIASASVEKKPRVLSQARHAQDAQASMRGRKRKRGALARICRRDTGLDAVVGMPEKQANTFSASASCPPVSPGHTVQCCCSPSQARACKPRNVHSPFAQGLQDRDQGVDVTEPSNSRPNGIHDFSRMFLQRRALGQIRVSLETGQGRGLVQMGKMGACTLITGEATGAIYVLQYATYGAIRTDWESPFAKHRKACT